MKFKLIFLFFTLTGGLVHASFAQNNAVGNWFIYFGNQPFSGKFNWHNEVQYRNYNFVGDLQQLLLRTGVGYNLSENNHNIHLGYAFIRNNPYIEGTDEKTLFNEHRIYQQFIMRDRVGRFFFQHRYRVEERFLNDDFRLRLRYFLALNIPLNKQEMEKQAYYLSIYNEIFINTTPNFFDRNRFYMALGYVLKKDLRVELGYMIQSFEDAQEFATYDRPQFQIVIFNSIPFLGNGKD
ncbi:DUF2490 domain-containing protein [Pararhodonellum marinum]|uniref:DUF2490 domain-containing protein n=1 Tax=Pararhodonellum marinum TaxID=2755358 RepID=UPI00188E470C|nr:DUF2490 domain-containing protein [Pararhodonellum marinum]